MFLLLCCLSFYALIACCHYHCTQTLLIVLLCFACILCRFSFSSFSFLLSDTKSKQKENKRHSKHWIELNCFSPKRLISTNFAISLGEVLQNYFLWHMPYYFNEPPQKSLQTNSNKNKFLRTTFLYLFKMNNETLKIQRQEMCMTQCLKAASKVSSKPKKQWTKL